MSECVCACVYAIESLTTCGWVNFADGICVVVEVAKVAAKDL